MRTARTSARHLGQPRDGDRLIGAQRHHNLRRRRTLGNGPGGGGRSQTICRLLCPARPEEAAHTCRGRGHG